MPAHLDLAFSCTSLTMQGDGDHTAILSCVVCTEFSAQMYQSHNLDVEIST